MKICFFLLIFLVSVHTVIAESDSLITRLNQPEQFESQAAKGLKPIYSAGIFYDYSPQNFFYFYPEIDFFNVKVLNQGEKFGGYEGSVELKRWHLGLQWGFRTYSGEAEPEIRTGLFTMLTSLNLGYNAVISDRWDLTPFFGLRYYRYRLTNSNLNYNIPLSQHLENRDLDLRFHQIAGLAGGRIAYKIYKTGTPYFSHFKAGLYSGFLFSLHYDTLVFSRRNQLEHNGRMHFEDFSIGLSFTAVFAR